MSLAQDVTNGQFWDAFKDLGWLAFDIWGGEIIGLGAAALGKGFGFIASRATSMIARTLGPILRRSCFAAGTQVVTDVNSDGTFAGKDIKDIQVGDFVLTKDQFNPSAAIERRQVVRKYVHTVDHLRILKFQDANGNLETIKTTDTHPFWVIGFGWVQAGDVRVGMVVSLPDGGHAALISSDREEHPEGVTV